MRFDILLMLWLLRFVSVLMLCWLMFNFDLRFSCVRCRRRLMFYRLMWNVSILRLWELLISSVWCLKVVLSSCVFLNVSIVLGLRFIWNCSWRNLVSVDWWCWLILMWMLVVLINLIGVKISY